MPAPSATEPGNLLLRRSSASRGSESPNRIEEQAESCPFGRISIKLNKEAARLVAVFRHLGRSHPPI